METEIWKDIEGYEGYYQVSDNLNIKSISRLVKSKKGFMNVSERLMKYAIGRDGYNRVGLTKDRKQKHLMVHRIISTAFIPNPENKPCINHKNGIKTDNRIENLEWCTHKENSQHAYDNKLSKAPWSGKLGKDNKDSKPIHQFTKSNVFVRSFDGIAEASRITGISKSSISDTCRNIVKSAGKFKWKFAY